MTILTILIFCVSAVFVGTFTHEIDKDDISQQYSTVETASGRVRGKQNRTLLDGKLFYSFRGIPFAKPPIDELRFKAPQVIDPWNDTLNAFEFGNDCIQHKHHDIFEGHEDCLYLNVYVPTNSTQIDRNAQLPVIFYIYGGRYVTGASNYYSPDFLLDEDVIVVTSNYRMGPLGFLALKLPEYSGNMGLKDQSLALKWVSENIGYFGGDKNQITMCGHSSGSVSIHLHLLSPSSSRLFQRAIMLSGSALSLGIMQKPNQADVLYKLANQMNYSISNEYEIIDFLNNIDGLLFTKKTYEETFVPANGTIELSHGWTIVVEDQNAVDPFLTESPFNILTDPNYESNIDVIFGSSTIEVVLIDEQLHPERLKILDEVFEFDLPLDETETDFKTDTYRKISKRIRDYYFDGKSITKRNLDRLHVLLSDIVFLYGIDLSARIQAKKSKARTLFSKFTAVNDWNWGARKRKESNFTIVFDAHRDQPYYLMRFSVDTPNEIYESLKQNSKQRQIVKNVAKFYANFAKFGCVEANEEPIEFNSPQSNRFKYYDITNDGIFVRSSEQRERFDFWDNLLNEFRSHWNITFDFHKLQ